MIQLAPDLFSEAGPPHSDRAESPTVALPPAGSDLDVLTPPAELEAALQQTIDSALDFNNWEAGSGYHGLERARNFLTQSIQQQSSFLGDVRRQVLSQLKSEHAPESAGVYRVSPKELQIARRRILMSGNATAVRGAMVGHDSLTASLISVGICMTKYDGQIRSWRNTFMRHECNVHSDDPVADLHAFLNQRAARSRFGPASGRRDTVSRLMRRAFQSAAERKTLLERVDNGWRLGYGVPAPFDLLTGSGCMALVDAMLPIFEDLLLNERRWVFIPDSLSSLAYATLAAALEPRELAIFHKAKATLDNFVERGHFDPEHRVKVKRFVDKAGDAIVIGGFRANEHGPSQLYFAHAEHAIHAGIVAMADAELQPHRGFPLLLDLASLSCKTSLGIDAFQGVVQSAYAKAGAGRYYASANTSRSTPED